MWLAHDLKSGSFATSPSALGRVLITHLCPLYPRELSCGKVDIARSRRRANSETSGSRTPIYPPSFAGNPNGVVVYPPYSMGQTLRVCCRVARGTNARKDIL